MDEFYWAKFNELSLEFNRYLLEHPDFLKKIPQGAEVILLDQRDPKYNRYMLEAAPQEPGEQPLVFIDVGKLEPVRSRLKKPKVVQRSAAKKEG